MIGGWTAPVSVIETPSPVTSKEALGRIVDVRRQGNMELSITIQTDDGTVLCVTLDGIKYPSIHIWMTIGGARKLLVPGVQLLCHHETQHPGNNDTIEASHITILGALPATPYLARLLSYSFATLNLLFPSTITTTTSYALQLPLGLAVALRPWTMQQCEAIVLLCQKIKADGDFHTLFKQNDLLRLAKQMREGQGWLRKARDIPPTSPITWSTLVRFEQQWCRDCDGNSDSIWNEKEEKETMTNTIMTMTDHDPVGSVDPALHLPNPNDARRIKYINERKRPQVKWMLGLIQKMLNGMNPQRVLQLVDIGGGRGDLANAVAAYFTRSTNTRVHITVMDNNESSLEAGRCAATTAGLDSCMTFLLCDLNDATEVATLLPTITTSFDLVLGLHCCGGLAEAAVELALKYRASFCISTCCFRSNRHLASLTRLAGVYQHDVDLISTLAVMVGSQGQHRAMRALNAMRLVTAEQRFQTIMMNDDEKTMMKDTLSATPTLRTWQEEFPVRYSVQNRILVGKVDFK